MAKRLIVGDLETDPFKVGRIPVPFASGIYTGSKFISYWGDDCIERFLTYLETEPESVVYMHNGGKFDFFWFLKFAAGEIRIINSRIVSMRIGKHEFRDSFAIMPFPLRNYKKDEIDYDKLEADQREENKDEILEYLRGDCVYLYDLVTAFNQDFGDNLTVGGSSLKQLKKLHPFKSGSSGFDTKFRKPFYHGGRVQCFQTGILHGNFQVIDVNSMYPFVMSAYLHPIGVSHDISNRIETNTSFVVVTGHNRGAFPTHTDNGLDFSVPYGTFSTTIHEFNAAIDTGIFDPVKIEKTYGFKDRDTFGSFVSLFYSKRADFKASGDAIRDLLYKYVLNSAYGKFAQNPENFYDWKITKASDPLLSEKCLHCSGSGSCSVDCRTCSMWRDDSTDECCYCNRSGFRWHLAEQNGDYYLWQARVMRHSWYNVATGASITGASRAVLLRGLSASSAPVYCDTDSIICSGTSVECSDSTLGAWKLEATADVAAICGKKLYALFSYTEPPPKKGKTPEKVRIGRKDAWLVKKAHKGARLTGAEILRIAAGETIEYSSPVPAFKLDGRHQFVTRRIRRTA